MSTITFEDFQKLDLRIGTIESAERVEGADKLLKLEVSLGSESRTLVAGVAESYRPEELPGKQIVVLVNLEPKTLRGVESNGMLFAAVADGKPVLLQPDKEVPAGTKVS
ncbi:MAG: methionine--tRNA ligase subunit beta [Candidatus Aenigmarchaeota archaeon]|nr:methionine--tRNA ligase subunit beta [Candidatus Aenigmarchaeota archaeon]